MSKNYRLVPAQTTVARTLRLVVALKEGFGPGGRIYHEEMAYDAIEEWLRARAADGAPYLDGMATAGPYISAHGSGDSFVAGREPAIEFSGCISVSHLANMPDSEVEEMLSELAAHLAHRLGQERVLVFYRSKHWAVALK